MHSWTECIPAASTAVISTTPNLSGAAGSHRGTRRVQPQPKHHEADRHLGGIYKRQSDVSAATEPLAPIQHEPHIAGNDESEPRAEDGADEAEQVTEDRDGLGNNPGQCPGGETDTDPGACSNEATAVQVRRIPEEA